MCGATVEDGTLVCIASVIDDTANEVAIEAGQSFESFAPAFSRDGSSFDDHACGILESDRTLACYAAYDTDDTVDFVAGPNEAASAYRKVVTARHNTCAIREDDDMVECWGEGWEGASAPSEAVRDLSSFYLGFCAVLASDGSIDCWGRAEHAVIDDVPEGTGFLSVHTDGGDSSMGVACAVHETQRARCWGQPAYGAIDLPRELELID
ncbi:MAG: hypothetical protein EA397_18060 [Deltaproteobacteria bacterium]|nr:MAG: hypothetical protein EA397_18060 [Deltaproteobacteria bacterium]